MIKKSFLFALSMGSSLVFGQLQDKNLFTFTANVGASRYEVENQYSANTINKSIYLGKEFRLGEGFYLVGNLGYSDYFYNVKNNAVQSSFVEVPLGIRVKLAGNGYSNYFYASYGLNNKFNVRNKVKTYQNEEAIETERGYNLMNYAELGYATKFHNRAMFFVGLNYGEDILQSGYKNKTMINNMFSISMGLNIFSK